MINLIEIVKNECISERNCMLSLYSEESDSGFLYFKEAQLIEVNAGKLWGKEALATIVGWNLSSYNISELPRGIKRTIWEPLDQIFAELVDAESAQSIGQAMGSLQMDDVQDSSQIAPALQDHLAPVVRQLQELPGFLAVFKQSDGNLRQLSGVIPSQSLSTDWFLQFTTRASELGEGLGAGSLQSWFLEVEDCRCWFLPFQETCLLVFSTTDGMVDDFEQACREVLS